MTMDIDYKHIIKEMLKEKSTKSCTSMEIDGVWYDIEIKINKI